MKQVSDCRDNFFPSVVRFNFAAIKPALNDLHLRTLPLFHRRHSLIIRWIFRIAAGMSYYRC